MLYGNILQSEAAAPKIIYRLLSPGLQLKIANSTAAARG